jgi:hypothetical protein
MKKLLLTLVLSGIICSAFSQKVFKPISFYEGGPSMLDYGIFNIRKTPAPERKLSGLISIKDSVITITAEIESNKSYKIKNILAETTEQYSHKKLSIYCTDPLGSLCIASIEREPANTTKNEMTVTITNANGSAKSYTCKYLENLFEN